MEEEKIKVHQLAKELGIPAKRIVDENEEIKSHMSFCPPEIAFLYRAQRKEGALDKLEAQEVVVVEDGNPEDEIPLLSAEAQKTIEKTEVIEPEKPLTDVPGSDEGSAGQLQDRACPYTPEQIELSIRCRGGTSPCWPWRHLAAPRPKNKYKNRPKG